MDEYNRETPRILEPEPLYGTMPSPNREVIEYLTESRTFTYLEGESGNDEAVIDGDIPSEMKHHFYGFIGKDIVLSNLEPKDIELMKIRFKRARNIFRTSRSRSKFTHSTIRQLDNLENMFMCQVNRAKAGFERRQQTTQIQQNLVGEANPTNVQYRQRPGLLGKIFG